MNPVATVKFPSESGDSMPVFVFMNTDFCIEVSVDGYLGEISGESRSKLIVSSAWMCDGV